MVSFCPKAGEATKIIVMTDTDWAERIRDRRSTTCLVIRVGCCTLCACSRNQAIHSFRSGEAEFYGSATGIAGGLQTQEELEVFEMDLPLGIGLGSS